MRRGNYDPLYRLGEAIFEGISRFFASVVRAKHPTRIPLSGGLDREFVRRRWHEIEDLLRLGSPSNFKLAVLEADKLLSYVLEARGAPGANLGERLARGEHLFRSKVGLSAAWEAHRVRNALVHDQKFELLDFQAKKTLAKFRRGLEELGVI